MGCAASDDVEGNDGGAAPTRALTSEERALRRVIMERRAAEAEAEAAANESAISAAAAAAADGSDESDEHKKKKKKKKKVVKRVKVHKTLAAAGSVSPPGAAVPVGSAAGDVHSVTSMSASGFDAALHAVAEANAAADHGVANPLREPPPTGGGPDEELRSSAATPNLALRFSIVPTPSAEEQPRSLSTSGPRDRSHSDVPSTDGVTHAFRSDSDCSTLRDLRSPSTPGSPKGEGGDGDGLPLPMAA